MSRYPASNYYRLAIIASKEAREALSTAFLINSDYLNSTLDVARSVIYQQPIDVVHSDEHRSYNLQLEFYNPDRVKTGQDFIYDDVDATLFALTMSETETPAAVDGCTSCCLLAEQRLGIRIIPADNRKQLECFEFIAPDNQIRFDATNLNTDNFLKDLIEKLNRMRLDNEAQAAAYRALQTNRTPLISGAVTRSFSVPLALASLFGLPAAPSSNTTASIASETLSGTQQHSASPH